MKLSDNKDQSVVEEIMKIIKKKKKKKKSKIKILI